MGGGEVGIVLLGLALLRPVLEWERLPVGIRHRSELRLIAAIGVPLLERTSQPYYRGLRYLNSLTYDVTLAPRVAQLRLDLRMIAGRLELFLGKRVPLAVIGGGMRAVLRGFEILVISAVMQIGLALPMAYYFHRATVVGLPANVVVVPDGGVEQVTNTVSKESDQKTLEHLKALGLNLVSVKAPEFSLNVTSYPIEEATFFGGPKRRLGCAENRSRSERLLGF